VLYHKWDLARQRQSAFNTFKKHDDEISSKARSLGPTFYRRCKHQRELRPYLEGFRTTSKRSLQLLRGERKKDWLQFTRRSRGRISPFGYQGVRLRKARPASERGDEPRHGADFGKCIYPSASDFYQVLNRMSAAPDFKRLLTEFALGEFKRELQSSDAL